MRLEKLHQFITIAEHQSFSKAAKALYISQPSLSISINHLEKELGYKLFDRNTNGTTITEAGEQALALCKKIIATVDQMHQVQNDAKESAATMQIALCPLLTSLTESKLLLPFTALHPHLNIVINQRPIFELIEQIDKGIMNLGFICIIQSNWEQIQALIAQSSLASKVLVQNGRFYAFANKQHPLFGRSQITTTELLSENLLIHKMNTKKIIEETSANHILVTDYDIAQQLLVHKPWCIVLPDFYAKDNNNLANGAIGQLNISDYQISYTLLALYNTHTPLTFWEKNFLNHVSRYFQAES